MQGGDSGVTRQDGFEKMGFCRGRLELWVVCSYEIVFFVIMEVAAGKYEFKHRTSQICVGGYVVLHGIFVGGIPVSLSFFHRGADPVEVLGIASGRHQCFGVQDLVGRSARLLIVLQSIRKFASASQRSNMLRARMEKDM